MRVKYYLKKVDNLVIPTRANDSDAGYDIIAASEPKVVGDINRVLGGSLTLYTSIDYIEYETNLYFYPEPNGDYQGRLGGRGNEVHNFHTDIRARSSISKYNLVLANSVPLIDRDYRGQILLRFKYMWQPSDLDYMYSGAVASHPAIVVNKEKIYKKGDKIAQLLPSETLDIYFDVVDELGGNDRGGGFGSTDKK